MVTKTGTPRKDLSGLLIVLCALAATYLLMAHAGNLNCDVWSVFLIAAVVLLGYRNYRRTR